MRLTVRGLEIQLEQTDGAYPNGRQALFFIHGAGGDPSIWRAQVEHLGRRNPVYCMALPGHGGSSGSGEQEIQAYAQWVRETLDTIPADRPVVLVGHSMGGAIVLVLSVNPPSRVHGAVLVGSGAKLAVLPDIFHMLENDPPAFFRSMHETAFAVSTKRQVRDSLIRAMQSCPTSVIINDFRACDRFDIRDRLEEIRLPTLILCGDEDRLTPLKYADYLLEHIVDSRMRVVSKAGHMAMAERPGPLNEAIEKFVSEL